MIKSIFIGLYPILCLLGLVIAVDQYIHNYLFAAIGLVLLSLPMLVFLGQLFLTNVARTSTNLLGYSISIVIGCIILAYAFFTGRAETMAVIGFILALGWLAYIKWYSVFEERISGQLHKGQKLPKMSFQDENANTVSSDGFIGKKSILMFYRGNWCPLCMAQIKELAEEYKNLEAKGIQTILISPQPHKNTKKLAEKHQVGFHFLVDKDNAVAKQLNILGKNGLPMGFQVLGYDSDTVMPTIILIDEKGTIIHSDLTSNYRVRPEPGDLIKYF